MRKIYPKNVVLYLAIIFLIVSAGALYEGTELKAEGDNEPIPELYQNVNSTYMKEVITDLLNISKSYVFSDIMNNPPSPYNDSKFNITEELEKIKIDEDKPFYEFYREIRTALSHLRDSNLDLIGGKLPFNEPINFDEYHFCLPFKFYVDYTNDQDINMYIKEYTPCIDNYGEDVKEFIKKQKIYH